jgi:hypothetical protein
MNCFISTCKSFQVELVYCKFVLVKQISIHCFNPKSDKSASLLSEINIISGFKVNQPLNV